MNVRPIAIITTTADGDRRGVWGGGGQACDRAARFPGGGGREGAAGLRQEVHREVPEAHRVERPDDAVAEPRDPAADEPVRAPERGLHPEVPAPRLGERGAE